MKCETCKYAKVEYAGVVTNCQCRRYAPKPFEQGPPEFKAYWPRVEPGDWCGEWRAKDQDN